MAVSAVMVQKNRSPSASISRLVSSVVHDDAWHTGA